MRRLITMMMLSAVLTAGPAFAQFAPGDPGARTEHPATASYWGDTGLWFVPQPKP